MTAGATSCSCTICGTVCRGRFAGCAAVWARGPREVPVDAPRFAGVEAKTSPDFALGDGDARWRVPLEPLTRPTPAVRQVEVPRLVPNGNGNGRSEVSADVRSASPQERGLDRAGDAGAPDTTASEAEIVTTIETPDITARFAVAQLAELNERVDEMTRLATETTAESLQKVYSELRRITSLREVDLTEQAVSIFSAVQAGTDALEAFSEVVREVTDDLRSILNESLAAIGGTTGLAETIAEAQADVASVREDFGAALARIERDLSVMRQRLPAKGGSAATAPAKVSDEQISFIVDAVTEAVIGTLNAERAGRRR